MPASTYKPFTIALPKSARAGEKWRLGLCAAGQSGPEDVTLLDLAGDEPREIGVWSEDIELRREVAISSGPTRGVGQDKKGKKKEERPAKRRKEDEIPKQTRILRCLPLPRGKLRLVEQTSFDLDKVGDGGSV